MTATVHTAAVRRVGLHTGSAGPACLHAQEQSVTSRWGRHTRKWEA
jgi:hypothetical protein